MGSMEHTKAGGLTFSGEQLAAEIFQRPSLAALLDLLTFRWRQDFKMLDYREENVEDSAVSPPTSFLHQLQGLIF